MILTVGTKDGGKWLNKEICKRNLLDVKGVLEQITFHIGSCTAPFLGQSVIMILLNTTVTPMAFSMHQASHSYQS